MSKSLLGEMATEVVSAIEEMNQIQNAEQIEAFCEDLIPFYKQALSDLAVLLDKQGVLDSLSPIDNEGMAVVIQQGRALVRQTTEKALIDRRDSLSAAVCDYMSLISTRMAEVDKKLETRCAQLRARLEVLYSLCLLVPNLFSREMPLLEALDRELCNLDVDPFHSDAWQQAGQQARWLAGEVSRKMEGKLSPESVTALTALAMGQTIPFNSLEIRSFKELLGLSVVAEQLVIQMKAREEK